jgi:hypothetical protein
MLNKVKCRFSANKIISVLLIFLINNLSFAQKDQTLMKSSIGTINQAASATNIGNQFAQLTGFEKRRLQLPFTDSVAEYDVQKIGHNYVMDGDIIVDDDYPKTQSYISNERKHRWVSEEIPINLHPSIYFNNMQNGIIDVLNEMNKSLPFKFKLRTNEVDYITFYAASEKEIGKGVAGSSPVGKQGGEQYLNLLIGNTSTRTINHEMLHALGVYHEMNRADRDNFVKIYYDNIIESAKFNFNKVTAIVYSPILDFCSIMMYSQNGSFNVDPKKNIWDRVENGNIIASPTCNNTFSQLSVQDIVGLQSFYRRTDPSNYKIDKNTSLDFSFNKKRIIENDPSNRYEVNINNIGLLQIIRKKDNNLIWGTSGKTIMQLDGNIIAFDNDGKVIWSTNTSNNYGGKLQLEAKGNLVIYNKNKVKIWESNSFDNNYPIETVQITKKVSANGLIKWKPEVGNPFNGFYTDWFLENSFGPITFEDNPTGNVVFLQDDYSGKTNVFKGNYIDFKKTGTITYSPMIIENGYCIVRFKLVDYIYTDKYIFTLDLNPTITWTGQTIQQPNPLTKYVIAINPLSKYERDDNNQLIELWTYEVTGTWVKSDILTTPMDVKISKQNPGTPIMNQDIKKQTQVNQIRTSTIKTIIKQKN